MSEWRRHAGRVRWMVVALAALSAVLRGCSAPDQLNTAATVNGHIITTDQYRMATRLYRSVDGLQSSLPGWQQPAGRQELKTSQYNALTLLITTELLKKEAQELIKEKKIPDTLKSLDASVDSQEKSQFPQLTTQYQTLIDQGILTPESYRLLLDEQIYGNAVLSVVSVPIAHVQMLTVADQATAQKLQKQLQGGAKWADLVKQYSTDAAKSQDGDIPQLPQGVLDPALDHVIFAAKTPDPKAIQVVQVGKSWAVLQVLEVKQTLVQNLDASASVINGGPPLQRAAISAYLNGLYDKAAISVNVHWCNDISGKACDPLRYTNS